MKFSFKKTLLAGIVSATLVGSVGMTRTANASYLQAAIAVANIASNVIGNKGGNLEIALAKKNYEMLVEILNQTANQNVVLAGLVRDNQELRQLIDKHFSSAHILESIDEINASIKGLKEYVTAVHLRENDKLSSDEGLTTLVADLKKSREILLEARLTLMTKEGSSVYVPTVGLVVASALVTEMIMLEELGADTSQRVSILVSYIEYYEESIDETSKISLNAQKTAAILQRDDVMKKAEENFETGKKVKDKIGQKIPYYCTEKTYQKTIGRKTVYIEVKTPRDLVMDFGPYSTIPSEVDVVANFQDREYHWVTWSFKNTVYDNLTQYDVKLEHLPLLEHKQPRSTEDKLALPIGFGKVCDTNPEKDVSLQKDYESWKIEIDRVNALNQKIYLFEGLIGMMHSELDRVKNLKSMYEGEM